MEKWRKSKLKSEKMWKIGKKSIYLSFIISMTFALINLPFFYIILFQVYFPKLFALSYFPFTNVILFQVYFSKLKLNSEKIWKIEKKIVKRHGNYEKKIS
jgi:uncharacterized membrane protein